MPTYICTARPGLISDQQKRDIVAMLMTNHTHFTGAPGYFVQVIFNETNGMTRFVAGKPADDHIWVRGDFRTGRTEKQRSDLCLSFMRDMSKITGVHESKIWVYINNMEPTDMIEYGQLLPLPGKEGEWFEGLDPQVQAELKG